MLEIQFCLYSSHLHFKMSGSKDMRFFFLLSSILVLLLAVFLLIADRRLDEPCRGLARSRRPTQIFSLQTACHIRRRLLEFSAGHFTRASAEEAAGIRRKRERSQNRKEERAQSMQNGNMRPKSRRPRKHRPRKHRKG